MNNLHSHGDDVALRVLPHMESESFPEDEDIWSGCYDSAGISAISAQYSTDKGHNKSQGRFSSNAVSAFDCNNVCSLVGNHDVFTDEGDSDILDDDYFLNDDYDVSPDVTFAPTKFCQIVAGSFSSSCTTDDQPGCRLDDILNACEERIEENNEFVSSDYVVKSEDGNDVKASCSLPGDRDISGGIGSDDVNVDSETDKFTKHGRNDFGVNRLFTSGEIVQTPNFHTVKNGFARISTNRGPYVHKLVEELLMSVWHMNRNYYTNNSSAPPSTSYSPD
ncbi:hypothetical protein Y032_0105g3721 [Ancylostoma ceylanicum]|uniref:Uncharacterized protein n=2 Tax=Ancylostoma ceylanicum TaxID=53326 RepID=A0A016TGG8_9BILA|nr:hypothetical protein Y032_0105g3721 [Ancylostoma ceylanicum]